MRGNTSVLGNAVWRVTITVDLNRLLGERYDTSSREGQDESTSADFDPRRVTRLPDYHFSCMQITHKRHACCA